VSAEPSNGAALKALSSSPPHAANEARKVKSIVYRMGFAPTQTEAQRTTTIEPDQTPFKEGIRSLS
jgi:hypothetical protein